MTSSVALHSLGDSFRAEATFLGERIDVRGLDRLADYPVVMRAGAGVAVLFRYGAVVLFGVGEEDRAALLRDLEPRVAGAFAEPEREAADVRIRPDDREGVTEEFLSLQAADVERLQVVAEILAKSVVLAEYEDEIAGVFNRIEPLAAELEAGAGGRHSARDLLRHIGRIFRIQHKMVGRVEVPEKPELLWEHPELERLYVRMEVEYELKERHAALERKLALINETAGTVLEVLQTARSLRLEWYIVVLIVVEIVLIVYDLGMG